ncbi:MAG TPA: GDSL-type esterase/lipase family protein, partial [Bacteroidales bacterium]|nr:GDSL-type esterase/lipase family protein [Bacteroidales bacterium]
MKKIMFSGLLAFLISLSACTCNEPNKVACVGDSITEGAGVWPQSELAYPVVLDSLLGDQYTVMNLGRSATTMLKDGNFPYWTAKEFSNVFAYEPEVIIIKLGTNDTKPQNWDAAKYESSYQAMIDTFKTMP